MRFSLTNTFHGQPESGATLLQWGPTILEHVQVASFAGGGPAWFMIQTTDGVWRYVEVTWEDFLAISPQQQTTVADADSDSDSDDGEPVNSHGLGDNCYYVTAAQLSGMTTNELIDQTEIMQDVGGVPLNFIVNLFRVAGLNSTYSTHNDIHEVETAMAEYAHGLDKNFGLAYVRANGTGHMIVATYDATEQSCTYYDYQIDADGKADAEAAGTFHLFPQ